MANHELVLIGKIMKSTRSSVVLGLCLVPIASSCLAVGLRLPNQDPEAIARGNAFVATADNPSANYHNPAGITQLEGQQLSLGAYLISTNVDFSSPAGRAETSEAVQAVPQIHYVFSPEDSNFSWGLGVYVPYGLGIDYGRDTPISTIAQQGELKYITVNPVMAYEFAPDLSIAAGITANYSSVDIRQEIGLVPGDEFRVTGDDISYGFNLGILWELNFSWALGASYRSATELDYEGKSRATSSPVFTGYLPTTARLKFPQNLDVGVAYHPTDLWTVEINLDWTDWSTLKSTAFEGTAIGTLPMSFNYKDSLMYEFGLTRKLSNNLLLSAGYIYSENSAPDLDFKPLNPDSNLHLGSLGVSSRDDKLGWAVAYHFAYNGGRDVSGNRSNSLIGQTADGHYETFNQALNISLRYYF